MRRIDQSTRSSYAFSLAFLFLACVLMAGASADDGKPPAVVAAADAKNHIDAAMHGRDDRPVEQERRSSP